VAVISALEISVLGTIVVFFTLMALAALVWVIGRLLAVITARVPISDEKPGNELYAVQSGLEEQERDLAVIAAVMKELGVEGELRIVKVEGRI